MHQDVVTSSTGELAVTFGGVVLVEGASASLATRTSHTVPFTPNGVAQVNVDLRAAGRIDAYVEGQTADGRWVQVERHFAVGSESFSASAPYTQMRLRLVNIARFVQVIAYTVRSA